MTLQHLRLLLTRIDANAIVAQQSRKPQQFELALRDAMMLTYLFVGCRRGSDLLYTDWGDLHMRVDGGPLMRAVDIWRSSPSAVGNLVVTPERSKVGHNKRPESQLMLAQPDLVLCPVMRLKALRSYILQNGRADEGPICCSLTGIRGVLSSQGLNDRVRALVQRYGTDSGETMHGLRRGGMQQLRSQNVSEADIMQQACILTPAVYRKYIDMGRHLL
jgi:hypothetical protein